MRLRCLGDAPDAFGSTLAEEQERTDTEWRTRTENKMVAHFLAATADRDDVGIAVCAPSTQHEQTAGLFGMWVAPEARQQGIGAALVHTVIEWAQNENYRRLILDVANSNIQAIRLYESCGFVPTGKTGALPPPRQQILEHEMAMILD
ncbi:GNAT family N-acetyltransferase [Novipirellula sp. SH528]|uniref:GNAT family N-acetyltransferase n=1 Tax=Novipirellula sp. SH528 TaxID=3454466 RepID=UPI003FA02875